MEKIVLKPSESLGFRSESLEEDGDILNFAIGPKVALKTSKPEQDKWNKNTMQEKLMYTLIMKNKQQIKKETRPVFLYEAKQQY